MNRNRGTRLKGRREAFCQAYISDPARNGSKAAREAGYAAKSAHAEACRLLKDVKVRTRIAELEEGVIVEAAEKRALDRDYVLAELQAIAETSASDTARTRALELLGKHLRLFTDVIEERSPERDMTNGEAIAAIIETLEGLPQYREAVFRHFEQSGDIVWARPRLVESA